MTRTKLVSILERQGVEVDEGVWFSAPIQGLLGSNPKVVKGVKRGYATAIMHLSPSDRSGLQTCSNATAGCRAACLNTAGRGGMFRRGETDNSIQAARRRKTHWFFARRAEFMTRLDREIENHVKLSASKRLVPCMP